jgi:hypothetical protein
MRVSTHFGDFPVYRDLTSAATNVKVPPMIPLMPAFIGAIKSKTGKTGIPCPVKIHIQNGTKSARDSFNRTPCGPIVKHG